VTTTEPAEPPTFASLGLRESLQKTLAALGYEAPTPIQARTIPVLLAGRNLIGQAQTGTGKTAAFALPILEKVDPSKKETQALVLTPTRELAVQVAEALHSYAAGIENLNVLPVYGGAPIVNQLKRLDRGVQIVVGTPGRLIDHLDRKSLRLDKIRFIVLDEADEMLKMGFIDDVERILGEAPPERQIALFSATMPPEVTRIAQRHMAGAERVEIEHKTLTAPLIEQRFLNVSEAQKLEVLTQMLELEEGDATLIFRRTKNGAAELAERLIGRGFAAVAMHGDMKQMERESVIRRLKSGAIEIVVATDVAARGLDVEHITHVINYDIPHDVEAYVHRIGRTGRAGRTGVATLFLVPRERRMMREIERYTGMAIKPMKIPTRADVAARRVAQLKDTLRKSIQEGDLDLYLELVEQLVEEGPHDIAEVAAAAARLASAGRPIASEPEIIAPPPPPPQSYAPRIGGGSKRTAEHPHDRGVEKVRLSMAVGANDGIRPADVVGSIANEAGLAGRDIGPIDIRDDITFVSVPAASVDHVIESVGRAKFRGRPVNLKVAGPGDEAAAGPKPFRRDGPPPRRNDFVPHGAPKREYGARPDGPPKRPYTPRADGPPKRPYGARTDGPPKRSYGPRPDGPPKREYGARPDGPPKRPYAPRTDDRPGSAFNRFAKPGGPRPKGGPKGPPKRRG
jgi:ATP-dependent RNA helicase DeaD